VVPPGGTAQPQQPPAAPAPVSDRAQLSALSGILASALEASPAHVAKVSELGAAVSSGQYRVDASAVSGSIIEHILGQNGLAFGGSGLLAANS
jgi:anti-sigma28 factor (negative regulator of flagellin synthesis)